MFAEIPLFPEQASALARHVDNLLFFLVAVTGTVAAGVIVVLLYFAGRYQRTHPGQTTPRIQGSLRLELFWTITPLFFFAAVFLWGAWVYQIVLHPPADSLEVYVVGKQWMWKLQHPGGQREINTLHIPVGKPVKLTLISEDVIHDFFVPAFRTKLDVLPNRYVTTWYLPTKTGQYHLFCSQYCGTSHAQMVGTVYVMEPWEYDEWLRRNAEGSPALEGRKLFLKYQCISCHGADSGSLAPVLENLYGRPIRLKDGKVVTADANYIRESILRPRAKVVEGWEPIMPPFQGLVSEEEMLQLIAFLRALGPGETPSRTADFPPPVNANPEGRSEKP